MSTKWFFCSKSLQKEKGERMNFAISVFLLAAGLVAVIVVVTELRHWFNAKKDEKTMDMKRNGKRRIRKI